MPTPTIKIPDWARTVAQYLTPAWRKVVIDGVEMELHFTDAQHRAHLAASTAWQQIGMNEEAFWSQFFAELLPLFPEVSTREACRRFRIPPSCWPIETLQQLADAHAKQEDAKRAVEEASNAVAEAEAQQLEYKRALDRQRDINEAVELAESRKAELDQSLAEVMQYRESDIYPERFGGSAPAGVQWIHSVIRSYGAEASLRAAIADAPAQIARLRKVLAEVGKEVARFERMIAKAKKAAA